jgi:hypothetical protein
MIKIDTELTEQGCLAVSRLKAQMPNLELRKLSGLHCFFKMLDFNFLVVLSDTDAKNISDQLGMDICLDQQLTALINARDATSRNRLFSMNRVISIDLGDNKFENRQRTYVRKVNDF